MKLAAGRRRDQVGRVAGDAVQFLDRLAQAGRGVEQAEGVGMSRAVKHVVHAAQFDDLLPIVRASYEVDLPNGGDALLIGNVIGQSAASENRVIVAYGAEGNAWPQSRLRLVHNTLISEGARPAWFVRVWIERLPAYTRLQAVNNLGVGPADFTLGAAWATEGNFSAPESVLEAADALDFALVRGSTLRGAGVDPLAATGSELVPRFEFALPLGKQPLSPPARWSPGAVQR